MLLTDVGTFKDAILNITLYDLNNTLSIEDWNSYCGTMNFVRASGNNFSMILEKKESESDSESEIIKNKIKRELIVNLVIPSQAKESSNYLRFTAIFSKGRTVVAQIDSVSKVEQKTAVIVNIFPFIDSEPFGRFFIKISKSIRTKLSKSRNNLLKTFAKELNKNSDKDKKDLLTDEIFSLKISGKSYFLYQKNVVDDVSVYENNDDIKDEDLEDKKNNLDDKTDLLTAVPPFMRNKLVQPKINKSSSFFDKNSLDKTKFNPKAEITVERSSLDDGSIVEKNHTFTIIGKGLRIPVDYVCRLDNSNKSYLEALRVSLEERANESRYFCLGEGIPYFSDNIQEGLTNEIRYILNKIYESEGAYLSFWETYGNFEIYLSIKQSKETGYGLIKKVEYTKKGCCLTIRGQFDVTKVERGAMLILSPFLPHYFNDEFDLEKYDESIITDYLNIPEPDEVDTIKEKLDSKFGKRQCSSDGREIKKNSSCIFDSILLQKKIVEDGEIERNKSKVREYVFLVESKSDLNEYVGVYIYQSIVGNYEQYFRRKQALDLIKNGLSENPDLGLLLEDSPFAKRELEKKASLRKSEHIPPLSDRIKNKIFSINPPTQVQLKAIDIAINTPDIALIQGPPGTGKTTVITAIIERLNELSEKNQSVEGSILVSGYQHDAVENILDRLSINSLPPVKFGNKGNSAEHNSATTTRIENWASNLAKKIRSDHPEIKEHAEIEKFNILINEYKFNPSVEMAYDLLTSIISGNFSIKSDLVDKAKELRSHLKKNSELENTNLIDAVNRLRTKKSSFADDGISNCLELSFILKDDNTSYECSPSDIALLERASVIKDEQELDDYLDNLLKLKKRMLYDLVPNSKIIFDTPNEELLDLGIEILNNLKEVHSEKDSEEQILCDFLVELENNPLDIRHAIESYQVVYSATTQQSLGKQIKRAKFSDLDPNSLKNKLPSYDTVIIDEAARATPSDLLIPMVQAKNRIILVGDHRQLPHMVNQLVENSMKEDSSLDMSNLKKSMFEYLFYRLKKLESIDGIKRTITLDAQYRTTPILGKFCSDNFYANHDASEGYKSPLGKEYFSQNLPGIAGLSCMFKDIPYSPDNSPLVSSSKSLYRPKEAEVCVDCLSRWIDSPEGKNLSFGIITFYSAQVQAIMECLAEEGYATKSYEDGSYVISDTYKFLPNGKERLRVGSVDAFQGMEFDVVLLSIVRSMSYDDIEKYSKNGISKTESKVAGFLAIENRLCVAMSRQKRFLAVIGDLNYIKHPIMQKYVPSLYKFSELCSQQNVGIIC